MTSDRHVGMDSSCLLTIVPVNNQKMRMILPISIKSLIVHPFKGRHGRYGLDLRTCTSLSIFKIMSN